MSISNSDPNLNPNEEKKEISICNNYIGGQFVAPKGGLYMDVTCPHDGSVIAKVALSSKHDVDEAVLKAKEAFVKWSKWTVKERAHCLLKLRSMIEEKQEELAEIIMKEHGKNKAEALGDISKGNETVEYACSMPQLISGKILEVSNGVYCSEFRLPHGVVCSIVPFNFPLMVPLWTMPIALAVGNCFILKPSEKVPLTMNKVCSYMKECGFPDGVFQIINGTASAVNALIDNPDIKALSFVGSTNVAQLIYNKCKQQIPPKRCLCLGGAKNHLIALNDCNIEMTSTDVVNSFCGCTGQRCMAASVLILVGEQKELLNQIIAKASELRPGKGRRDLGPVIDQPSLDKIHKYISLAENDKQTILLDGREWSKNKDENDGNDNNDNNNNNNNNDNKVNKKGYWIGPTIILFHNPEHCSMLDEIFGPVLSVYIAKNREEAIAIENANQYGNAACVYTSNGESADWFTKRFQAGMIGVNVGVPVPREPFSFGGINHSKFGDFDITADGGIEFWTWRKKVTTKWTPPQMKSWMD